MRAGKTIRVLIVGGYGVFGGRLAHLLAIEPGFELIIAGRSIDGARRFIADFNGTAAMTPTSFDRNGEVLAQLKAIAPDVIVDASGPFQTYGSDPYRLINAAIALKINYLDLADSADFVWGVRAFDADAKRAGVFVLSGMSTCPALTGAVARHLACDLDQVEAIRGGIAPSPYANVGRSVIEAIMAYAGKKIPLLREGRSVIGLGFIDHLRFTICPPGALPLKATLFSLVDCPDLRVLRSAWPGLRTIWMGAAPSPDLLHRGLRLLARAVSLGLLASLTFLAPIFHWAKSRIQYGEHRGGMFVSVEGVRPGGAKVTRAWHLVADGDDGPSIPAMAAAAILLKCRDAQPPDPGARSGEGELELSAFQALFARFAIATGVREISQEQAALPLYHRILGEAWERLPAPIRRMHELHGELTATGNARVERGRTVLSRLVGWVFGFPRAGSDVPLTVRFVSEGGGEMWTRTFGSRSFQSCQRAGRGTASYLVEETFGIFNFGLALVTGQDRLSLVVRRWTCLGVPMPLALAPYGETYESVEDGRFCFHVEICLPLVGLIVRYRGSLVPAEVAVPV